MKERRRLHKQRIKLGLKYAKQLYGYGSDFRRDASRGSLFGFEYRVFDLFPSKYLKEILYFIYYLADHIHNFSVTNYIHHHVNDAEYLDHGMNGVCEIRPTSL